MTAEVVKATTRNYPDNVKSVPLMKYLEMPYIFLNSAIVYLFKVEWWYIILYNQGVFRMPKRNDIGNITAL